MHEINEQSKDFLKAEKEIEGFLRRRESKLRYKLMLVKYKNYGQYLKLLDKILKEK